jgi:hypothetical protein
MNDGKGASLALEAKGTFAPERNGALILLVSVEGGLCGAGSLVDASVIEGVASLALAMAAAEWGNKDKDADRAGRVPYIALSAILARDQPLSYSPLYSPLTGLCCAGQQVNKLQSESEERTTEVAEATLFNGEQLTTKGTSFITMWRVASELEE